MRSPTLMDIATDEDLDVNKKDPFEAEPRVFHFLPTEYDFDA